MLQASDDGNKFFNVKFEDTYNVVSGDNASGKTYLVYFLKKYLRDKDISYVHIDCDVSPKQALHNISALKSIKDSVIIVDNADVVLTPELERTIVEAAADTKIFMLHSFRSVLYLRFQFPGLYQVICSDSRRLEVVRIGSL